MVRSITFATVSLGLMNNEPRAIALRRSGCVQSRNINVALWRTGNDGMNCVKNMCMHPSRKTDVMPVDSTSAVTSADYEMAHKPTDFRGVGMAS